MTIVVTAASGAFGGLVVEELLAAGTAATDILATSRNPAKLAHLAARGVRTTGVDFLEPASLEAAFAGAEKVLLVSTDDFSTRMTGHRNAVAAAGQVGVGFIAYTSAPRADTTSVKLFADHAATEKLLSESGLPYASLRNNLYLETYLAQYVEQPAGAPRAFRQEIIGCAGTGQISGAARTDLAAAAATVLRTDGHAGRNYELGGQAFTLAEVAAVISEVGGRTVNYTDVSQTAYAETLRQSGMPAPLADIISDLDAGISRGELQVDSADLKMLAGRPLTTLTDAVRAALAYGAT